MKKLLKNNFKILIIVLITTIVASITSIFAYSLIAENVGFTPKDTTWNVENVEAALNNLNLRYNQLSTHYSTEEQVVGEWVDGKPLYQKTFLNVSLRTVLINGVDTVVNYIVYREYSSGERNLRIISDGNNVVTGITLNYNNGDIKLEPISSSYGGGTILHATIQYTKTTD